MGRTSGVGSREFKKTKRPGSPLRASRGGPPAELQDFQRWFARAASRPLLPGNATRPGGVDGPSLRREADARLRSLGGMSGLERLEVYNRQYWFRLITCMQDEFPCCLHVIGLDAFNSRVIRYLDAVPPTSPYLADMDTDFSGFLRRRFRMAKDGKKREQVLEAAAYDKAFSRAFDGAPAPGVASRAITAATKWTLAAHVTPLWLHWDFAAYRVLCREDEALTGRFPLRRRAHGVCLHRHGDTLYEKPLAHAEFLLLRALEKPRTLDQVFRAAGKGATARDLITMERNVAAWFRDWTELGWIVGNEELRVKN
jgi:hypothetical protein